MKPVHLVLTITFAIAAMSATAWLMKSQGTVSTDQPELPVPAVEPEGPAAPFVIPATGPYGKAVTKETTFDFGVMEKGGKGTHTFVIINEGPGPLRVKQGMTSCGQCTIGKVSPENEDIPVGGSANVQIDWEIKIPASRFRQTADIHTTDPENKKLVFTIQGQVDSALHLVPDGNWLMGDLSETEPSVVEGLLYSSVLDEVVIDRVEVSSPLVTVTWDKATASQLAERKGKSGAKIKVTVAPASAIGPMRETVKLHTAVRGGTVIEFTLSGRRPGPIEIKGRGFTGENNLLRLGEFPAEQGTKSKLQMYVRNLDGELEAEQIDSEQGRVQVRVAPTGKTFGKSKVYEIEVEIPPGPPGARMGKDPQPVLLKLNHPSATEFKFYVDYFAR